MGTVYKRGKYWWVQYYHNGRKQRESSKSTKQVDAKRFLARREGEIAEGRQPGVQFDKVRFEDLARLYLDDYRNNARRSMDKAERIVRLHLKPAFGRMRVTDITTALIQRYIGDRIKRGASNGTINRELTALKRMMRLGADQTPPLVALVPRFKLLSEDNIRTGFFELSQFEALRAALPEYLRGVVTFAYETGWRRSEILGLTWDNVDIRHGTARLEPGQTKNKEGRTIFLSAELISVLKEQMANRHLGCPFVFHREGNQIKDFYTAWKNACKRARIPGKIFHDFRRTAIRDMIRSGISESRAMKLSGHKTRVIFMRYDIVSEGDLREAAQRLENYRQQEKGTQRAQTEASHSLTEPIPINTKD